MSRVALDLGFIQIYWYSIFIFLGILFAMLYIHHEIKKFKINEDFIVNMLFYVLLFGIIGARLYFVAFNFNYYMAHPLEIFEIWNGGLAIHGGIIAGSLVMLIYTKKYKQNVAKIFDITAVGLLLGQAIGRWGNFFNQEAFGKITSKIVLQEAKIPEFIINNMYIDGAYRQPTFLYESVWNIFGFLAALIIKRYKYLKNGQLVGFYLMWYSLGRFFIESLRSDSLMLGPLKVAQVLSVILFIIGFIVFLVKGRGSRFDNLYKEVNNNEINF
ncbi:MAG: prolipoprotein diacylglyceryl transferase [Bacilli bacterium]